MAQSKPQTKFVNKVLNSIIPINTQMHLLLKIIIKKINKDPFVNQQLKTHYGWLNAIIVLKSEDEKVAQTVIFEEGKVRVEHGQYPNPNLNIIFITAEDAINQLTLNPDEATKMILRGRTRTEGNFFYMGILDYFISLVLQKQQTKDNQKLKALHQKLNLEVASNADMSQKFDRKTIASNRISQKINDLGVKYLKDPYFQKYGLEDFPRLKKFREDYIQSIPQLSAEYGKLLTDFFIEHGFEKKKDGTEWDPNLRHAKSFAYVMKNRKALIRSGDLLAGSYTDYPINSHVGHPYSVGEYVWGELITAPTREHAPFNVTEADIHTFHNYIFPYWLEKNILSLWRDRFNSSLSIRIQDRFFAIFYWKIVSMMEISPGYDKLLKFGLNGIKQQIEESLEKHSDPTQQNTLEAMKIVLDAIESYTLHLADRAKAESIETSDLNRKNELLELERILRKVPMQPPDTLYEAVQAIIIVHMMIGIEETDDGPSMGRLDQLLQPYFEKDLELIFDKADREDYIKRTIEILGSLFFRLSSHQIVAPDIGNWQNSGSPPNTVIIVGGIDENGEDAVNDMTYIILKVIELLRINDPNTHARYKSGKNSREYLERVCDVNFITGATPAIHGDDAIIKALTAHGWELEDVRGWTATGCVEPSIPGKHASATSSLEVNLVAPLEMALNNGTHPLMRWDLGPSTGFVEQDAFPTFEAFWEAFKAQVKFIVDISVKGNNELGVIYQDYLPSPLLSVFIDDCISTATDITRGGAKYNSTGTAIIGLADVVDSLYAIKKVVFDDKVFTFREMKEAIDHNFDGYEKIRAYVQNKVPKYGSRDPAALEMAQKVTHLVNDLYRNHQNYRGGPYATGWWSMAHHASYGRVTGALPSGRLDGEPFTPGLTPHPGASENLLDNLIDVSQLDPKTLDNNIAFNVRIVPSSHDSHLEIIRQMADYVETFLDSGGMQVQFNVVDTNTLKDAMVHPENYPDLMVRISGYCGYFTRLHRELQLEIIRRCEYGL